MSRKQKLRNYFLLEMGVVCDGADFNDAVCNNSHVVRIGI